MYSPNSVILAFVKCHGVSTVDELAQALSLAPMTVRQHFHFLSKMLAPEFALRQWKVVATVVDM